MSRLIQRGMLPMQGGVSHRLFASLPPLAPSPLPSRREAHLWYIVPDELKDASQLKKYVELLSSCERERVLSMNGENLRKDCRVNPQSIKFKTSKFGKPEIMWQHGDQCNQPSLQFNVSHSSSLIACGITVDVPIGIDVEEKQRKTMSSISSLASRYFSPSEVEYLGSFSNTDIQQKEFIKLWTLKEAYVKALGRGFSGAPFKDFTIRLEATKGMQLSMAVRMSR